jgi:hypothetical protein
MFCSTLLVFVFLVVNVGMFLYAVYDTQHTWRPHNIASSLHKYGRDFQQMCLTFTLPHYLFKLFRLVKS